MPLQLSTLILILFTFSSVTPARFRTPWSLGITNGDFDSDEDVSTFVTAGTNVQALEILPKIKLVNNRDNISELSYQSNNLGENSIEKHYRRPRFISGMAVTESDLRNNVHGAASIGYAVTSTDGFCVGVFTNSKTFVTAVNSHCNYRDQPWSIYEGSVYSYKDPRFKGRKHTSRIIVSGQTIIIVTFSPSLSRRGVTVPVRLSSRGNQLPTLNTKCVGFGYDSHANGGGFLGLNTINIVVKSFQECLKTYPFAKVGKHFCAEAKGPTSDTAPVCNADVPIMVMCYAADRPTSSSGLFNLDREVRKKEALPGTKLQSENSQAQLAPTNESMISPQSVLSEPATGQDNVDTDDGGNASEKFTNSNNDSCKCYLSLLCTPCDPNANSSPKGLTTKGPTIITTPTTKTYQESLFEHQDHLKWRWVGMMTHQLSMCNSHYKTPQLYAYIPSIFKHIHSNHDNKK